MSFRARWRRIVPDTLTTNVGTPTGDVSDVQIWQDGNQLAVQEAVATPGITITITFAKVTAIQALYLMGYYDGTHHVVIELWNYTTSAWDVFDTMEHGNDSQVYTPEVFDDSDYISSGAAQMRLNHPTAGDNSHDLYLDHIALLY